MAEENGKEPQDVTQEPVEETVEVTPQDTATVQAEVMHLLAGGVETLTAAFADLKKEIATLKRGEGAISEEELIAGYARAESIAAMEDVPPGTKIIHSDPVNPRRRWIVKKPWTRKDFEDEAKRDPANKSFISLTTDESIVITVNGVAYTVRAGEPTPVPRAHYDQYQYRLQMMRLYRMGYGGTAPQVGVGGLEPHDIGYDEQGRAVDIRGGLPASAEAPPPR
jgi:hypothetical protein